MSTDSQTLLTSAKCYLCLGVTMAEALQLALLASISQSQGSSAVAEFSSSLYPISAAPWPSAFVGTPFLKVAHGLGAVPKFYRAVFVCTDNDANWGLVAGQEIAIESIYQNDADVAQFIRPLQLWADSTFLYACPLENSLATGSEGSFLTTTGLGITGGGVDSPSSLGHFAVKLYASL